MRILSLEINNILSIENATLTFEDNGLVLVEGWNYDTSRANGAGKTAIFNCLSFCIYDKLPRKITASEIVRRGSKSGCVSVSLLCGEDTWIVQRSRPKGVKFFKNGFEQDITQSEFEAKLRLNYEQFLLTVYIPQANSRKNGRFLNAPDSDKKEFLLQLLSLNEFTSIKRGLDEVVKSKQALIDSESAKLNSARSKVEAHEESLIDIDSLIDLNKTILSTIPSINKQILELSQINKPDLSKFSKIEEDIRLKLADIAQTKAKKTLLHDRFRELKSLIKDYNANNSCTECGSILDTPEARKAHADHQQKVKQKVLDLKKQIDDADLICVKEQGVNDLFRKIRDKKQQESADYQSAQLKISELKSLIKGKTLSLENNESKIQSNTELVSKIETLKLSISKHIESIDCLKKELDIYKTLSSIYSPTGAQAYVLDSIVDSFNEIVQKYIHIMSPDTTYILNSFKETSNGDVVAKFSETLTKGGTEVSVGSLSGGEEKGLSLCVDFALLEVLETQFGMSLNPIILDEPFDGLDTSGREIVIGLLENLTKNRQILVIDHSIETKVLFSKVIRVELKDDVSKISIET
jgi:DNA repair exonuclease SbcCD ATPase subunit